MGKDVRNFVIGAALIAASFAVAGLPIVGPMLNGIFFATGAGIMSGALTETLAEHQSAFLSTGIGPMQAIPIIHGCTHVGTGLEPVDSGGCV